MVSFTEIAFDDVRVTKNSLAPSQPQKAHWVATNILPGGKHVGSELSAY